MPTFIDIFAGAGGVSEGFLQAEHDGAVFDFLLASDINPACELTHRLRYNEQLGLPTEFLTKDICSPDFIEAVHALLVKTYGETAVDVITGGPPCQSFSLAGERKKNDKKDDLFTYYLKLVSDIKPKYFVMENVEGILTKDEGKIKDRILDEIRNIIDYPALERVISICSDKLNTQALVFDNNPNASQEFFFIITTLKILYMENQLQLQRRADYLALVEKLKAVPGLTDGQRKFAQAALLNNKANLENPWLVSFCKEIEGLFVDTCKNNDDIPVSERNIIRQAIVLLSRHGDLSSLTARIKSEMALALLKNSPLKNRFDQAVDTLDAEGIYDTAIGQCESIIKMTTNLRTINGAKNTKLALTVLRQGVFESVSRLLELAKSESFFTAAELFDLETAVSKVALYRISAPITLTASDYGVPQNRVRVVFIGCRNDQQLITEIPATVCKTDRVSVAEAIGDLDFVGINKEELDYDPIFLEKFKKTQFGNIRRKATGEPDANGKTYAEWSRVGRLDPKRFPMLNDTTLPLFAPVYTPQNTWTEYKNAPLRKAASLQNHKTSNHTPEVMTRYRLIRTHGDYNKARKQNPTHPAFRTNKRSYACLTAHLPSPTIITAGDDYAHYQSDRGLTVREMARLQSFDDSFVFQGKRTTGGERRKYETPQYTQVGNAVPPLMARAIATEILRKIK